MSQPKNKPKITGTNRPTQADVVLSESIYEQAPVGIYLADKNGKCTYANQAWLNMAGLTLDEALGEGWKKGLHPDDRQEVFISWEKAAYEDVIWDREYRFLNKKKNQIAWVRGLAVKRLDQQGELAGYLGINIDITSRKQAEFSLEVSEQKLRLLTENIRDVIWQVGMTGKITFISPSVTELTGYSISEMDGMKYSDIVHPSALKQARSLFKAALSGKGFPMIETEIIHKNGARIPVESSITPINKSGKLISIQGIARDISVRKQTEQDREKLLTNLREVQQLANLGTWEWDLVNDQEYWSDELFHIFGREPSEQAPHPDDYSAQYHPQDRDKVHNTLERSLSKGFAETEFRLFRHDDQAQRTVRMRCRVENGADGLPARQIGTIIDITEQKQREQELSRLLSDLNNAQSISHVGSWDWDLVSGIETWSDEYFHIFGRDPSLGVPATAEHEAQFHPDDRERVVSALKDSFNTGFYEVEYRFFRFNDNKERIVHALGKTEFDEKGNPIRHIGTIQDITARKNTEIQLAESQQQYLSLVEDSEVLISRWLPDGTLTFVNRAYCEFFGKNPDELIGAKIYDVIPDQERELVREHISNVSPQNPAHINENKVIRHDGQVRWVRWTDRAFFDNDGKITHYQSFGVDIHGRRLAQEKLQENERVLSTLMGNLPGMAYRCENDADWTMRFVSQGCADLTGYQSEELLNNARLSYADLIHPDDRAWVRQQVQQAVEKERPFELTYRIHCKDGTEKWVWEKGGLIPADGGQSQYLEGFINDITERKRVDELLQENMLLLAHSQQIANIGSWKLDLKTNHIQWTDEVFRIFGYVPQAFTATYRTFLDAIHPDDRIAVDEAYSRSLKEDADGFDIEHRIVRPGTGEVRDVVERCIHQRDDTGAIISSIGMVQDITARKKAEMQLAESQQHYQSIVEDSPILISRFKPDGTITFTNHAYSQFFIGKNEGLIGENIYDYVLPDHQQLTRDYFGTFTPQDAINMIDDQVKRYDGADRWLRWTDRALFDNQGELIGFQTFGEDITDQKEYQLALQASEQRYQSVVEDAPLMIIRYLPDGTITFANAHYCQFYTGKKVGLPWKTIFDKYSPREVLEVKGILAALSKENPIYTSESLCKNFDGQQRWLRWKDVALYDEKGDLISFQSFGEDIHDQYIAEQKQREAERDLNALMANLPGIAYRADAHGRYIFQFLSQGCKQLTGYEPGEFLDNPDFIYEKIMVEEYKEPLIDQIKFAIEHNTPFEFSYRIITKGGEEKWVWERGSVVLDEAGKPHHIEGFITDITKTVDLQDKLRKNQDLLNASQRLSKAGGWEWDIPSQSMYWTEETFRIHDFSPVEIEPGSAELIERSLQCYDPPGRSALMAAYQRCLEQGQPYDLELPFTTAKGRHIWIRTTGQPKLKDGKMTSVIGNIMDISSQKAAEERLNSKAAFEQKLAEISTSFLKSDADHMDEGINDALKQFGLFLDIDRIVVNRIRDGQTMINTHIWSQKEIIGVRNSYDIQKYPWLFSTSLHGEPIIWSINSGFPDHLTRDELALFKKTAIQSLASLPIHSADMIDKGIIFSDFKNAEKFTPELVESLQLFAQIISNAITLRDAQREIMDSEARFRAFMDNFPANAYIKDEKGRHVFANHAASAFAGISQKEYIGKKTSDIYPAPLASELEELDQSVIHDQIIIEKEGYYTSAKGEKRYQRDIKFPIQGLQGEKLVGGIALDLTNQKEAEQRIIQQADFEKLLARISNDLIRSSAQDMDSCIKSALQLVGIHLDLDRIGISFANEKDEMVISHRWSAGNVVNLRNVYDSRTYPYLFNAIKEERITNWGSPEEFPAALTPKEKRFWRSIKILSLLSIPVRFGHGALAGITFSDTKHQNKFTPELVDSLYLFSQIIGNALTLRDAQRELMGSEHRYRSVVEDAPVLINRYRPDGTITFANQAYCDFMGKNLSELIGRKFFEHIPDDARQGAKERLKSLSADNPLYVTESKVFRADGQERWVRWTVRCLLDPHGGIDMVQSFGIDITDQRLAAIRIAASERQFRSLFTEMANAFSLFEVVRDKEGKPVNIAFIDANPAFERITGLRLEDITGKTINEVLPDFDRGWLQDYIDVALHDLTFERKDFNQRLGIYIDIRAFSPRQGQCAVLMTDITEQETLNRQVEIERDKAQNYLDTVQSIMIAMDENGNITLANQKTCQILGYSEEEILGKNWFDTCLPEAHIEQTKQVFQKILRGEMDSAEYNENPIRTRSGEELIIAWHNAKIRDRDGEFIGVLSAGEDITVRKAAEKRLQTLLDLNAKLISESYDQNTLQNVADEVLARFANANAVTIWLYDQDKHKLSVQAMSGYDDPNIIGLTVDISEGVVGQAATTRQSLLVQHAQQNEVFQSVGGFAPAANKIQCLLCTPLMMQDKLLGVISVDNFNHPEALNTNDLSLVESIANQLAGVVENALLFEQLQQSQADLRALSRRLLEVHEEERRAVALDLHDHFGQILTTFKLSLRPEAFIRHSEDEQRARLAEVTSIVDELIEAAEDLSLRLRPAILDDLGLAIAFNWHINRMQRQANVPIEMRCTLAKDQRFHSDIEITLYRVLEEGLSNALRHGNPTWIKVDLNQDQDHLHLVIQDDGIGFDLSQREDMGVEHTGLIGVEERVRLLDGTVELQSQPDNGTTLAVSIPLNQAG